MRYSVLNLGQADYPRYVPVGPADCANAAEYRKGVDNAAARIAFYQDAAQQAAAAGNDQTVTRAASGSDQANKDWSAWNDIVKKCEALAPAGVTPPGRDYTIIGIGAVGALLVVSWLTSKSNAVKSMFKSVEKPKRR